MRRCPRCRRPVEAIFELAITRVTYLLDGSSVVGQPDPQPGAWGTCRCGHEWRLRGVQDAQSEMENQRDVMGVPR